MTVESRIVRRAQAGDRAAFGELVGLHQAAVFRAVVGVTRSTHDAEEATQEAFVKAWRALGRFRPDEPFRPWVMRIAMNEAYSLLRSRERRRARDERFRQESPAVETEPGAEASALVTAGQPELIAAIQALPQGDQQVITCRLVLDLSERETALALRCRPGTVKSRLSRALDRLRADLDEAGWAT